MRSRHVTLTGKGMWGIKKADVWKEIEETSGLTEDQRELLKFITDWVEEQFEILRLHIEAEKERILQAVAEHTHTPDGEPVVAFANYARKV